MFLAKPQKTQRKKIKKTLPACHLFALVKAGRRSLPSLRLCEKKCKLQNKFQF